MLPIATAESPAHQFVQSPAHQRHQPDRRCLFTDETIPGYFQYITEFNIADVLVTENVEVAPGIFRDIQLNLAEVGNGTGHLLLLYMGEGAFRTTQNQWLSSNAIMRCRGYFEPNFGEDSYAPATPGYSGVRMTNVRFASEALAEATCSFFEFTHDGVAPVLCGWIEEDDLLVGNNWVPRVVAAVNGTPNPLFRLYRLNPAYGNLLTELFEPIWSLFHDDQSGVPPGFRRIRCTRFLRNNHLRFWWRLQYRGTFNGASIEGDLYNALSPSWRAQQNVEAVLFDLIVSEATLAQNVDQRSNICHPRGTVTLDLVEATNVIKTFEYDWNPAVAITALDHVGDFALYDAVVRNWYDAILHNSSRIPAITNFTVEVDIPGSINVKTAHWLDTPNPAAHTWKNIPINNLSTPDFHNQSVVGIEKLAIGAPATVKLRIWQNAVFQNLIFVIP